MKFKQTLILLASVLTGTLASADVLTEDELSDWNDQIRRDKFDLVLPQVMREQGIDMWIYVARMVRDKDPDKFAAEELGSSSGVFVFTDRGDGRIERAVLGRRWGASQRDDVASDFQDPIKALDAYDIVGEPVRIQEPVSGPITEYDLRFEGLREFVAARNPKRIGLNFKHKLGQWPTYHMSGDGLTHTDYLLLTEELGNKYASRIVSSEYVEMNYNIRKVPSEIKLLKRIRQDDLKHAMEAFDKVVPGVTKAPGATIFDPEKGVYMVIHRRMRPGLSQRGRSAGWDDAVVQGGDILAQPLHGLYAYVLREGETEPPEHIKKFWNQYLTVDRILAETIKVGLTPNQIIEEYTKKFEEVGIIVRDDQLHMIVPKNDFAAYSKGYDAGKTHLSVDSHAQYKGAHQRTDETYYAPRIGSYGPDWSKNMPLADNHHFVMEYFFYMPSPTDNPEEDQYLLWWDHEDAIATPNGVEYLSPPQKELYLIK